MVDSQIVLQKFLRIKETGFWCFVVIIIVIVDVFSLFLFLSCMLYVEPKTLFLECVLIFLIYLEFFIYIFNLLCCIRSRYVTRWRRCRYLKKG